MTEQGYKTILSADVIGYSHLMRDSEEAMNSAERKGKILEVT